MNISEALKLAGQIAGIGGISLAVFLILFREIIRKTIFPNLTKHQGYRLLTLIVILVTLIALAGIGAWLLDRRAEPASTDVNTAKLDEISKEMQALRKQIATDVVIPQRQIQEELRRSALERQDSHKVQEIYNILSARNADLELRILYAKTARESLSRRVGELSNASASYNPEDDHVAIREEVKSLQAIDRELEGQLNRLAERGSQLQEDLATFKSVAGDTLKEATFKTFG